MAQHINTGETPQISIDIADSPNGRKRKSRLSKLIFAQDEKYVSIICQVFFVNENGEEIVEAGTVPYEVERRATNNTIVNSETGIPIGELSGTSIILVNDTVVEQNEDGSYDLEYPIIGQYDWFYALAASENIIVNELITQFMTLVDWTKI